MSTLPQSPSLSDRVKKIGGFLFDVVRHYPGTLVALLIVLSILASCGDGKVAFKGELKPPAAAVAAASAAIAEHNRSVDAQAASLNRQLTATRAAFDELEQTSAQDAQALEAALDQLGADLQAVEARNQALAAGVAQLTSLIPGASAIPGLTGPNSLLTLLFGASSLLVTFDNIRKGSVIKVYKKQLANGGAA